MQRTLPRRMVTAVLGYTIVVAGLVAGPVIAPAPAQAVPGLIQTSAVSGLDGQPQKAVTAACPRGTVALDGGGTYTGGVGSEPGEIRLTGLYPTVGGFTATAVAPGYRGDWQLHSYAICAPRLSGMTYQSGTGALSDQWWRGDLLNCTGGKKAIGGGAAVTVAGGTPAAGVALQFMLPDEDLDRWRFSAYRVDPDYTEPWQLEVYLVCADPPPGLIRVVGQALPDKTTATVSCPPGRQVHGVGGGNNAAPTKVAIQALYPAGGLTSVTIGSSAVGGDPGVTWRPVPIAICAT